MQIPHNSINIKWVSKISIKTDNPNSEIATLIRNHKTKARHSPWITDDIPTKLPHSQKQYHKNSFIQQCHV